MDPIEWPKFVFGFDDAEPNPPLKPDYIELVQRLISEPLDEAETNAIRDRGGPDPDRWVMPRGIVPPIYLSFLAWSNGGFFLYGQREWNMLRAEELREYLLMYDFPATLPDALPFATDGSGGFYLFDLREAAVPPGRVIHLAADRFSFDDAAEVASDLLAAMANPGPPGDSATPAP